MQHLHALDGGPGEIIYFDGRRKPPRWLQHEVFDGVLLHNTFLGLRWNRNFERYRRRWAWIRTLDCPKVAVPQDEYNHARVLDEWLAELDVDHVMSNFDEQARRVIYPRLTGRARFSVVLTGYIDDATASYCRARARPLAERPLDVVYRAAPTRFWLGSHYLLKQAIGDAVLERVPAHRLTVDISTKREDRIHGREWLDLLLSSRSIIGAESGSSVLDAQGESRARVLELLADDPSLSFEQVAGMMPEGWDSHAFFAIGPRHLEAVVARTAQILVAGAYNGILEPERHYIPVKRDFSNLDDALERLHDASYLEELTSRAYEEIYIQGRWTIREFADGIREALGDPGQPNVRRRVRMGLRPVTIPTLRASDAVTARLARLLDLTRHKLRRSVKFARRSVKTARRSIRRVLREGRRVARGALRRIVRKRLPARPRQRKVGQ